MPVERARIITRQKQMFDIRKSIEALYVDLSEDGLKEVADALMPSLLGLCLPRGLLMSALAATDKPTESR